MRRFIVLSVISALMLTLVACGDTAAETTTTEPQEETQGEIITSYGETTAYYEETTAVMTTAAPETTVAPETTTVAEATTAEPVTEAATTAPAKEDVSTWDTARVVEFYKNAAAATGNSVQSSQTVGLSDISVNNGQLGGVFSFVTPILSSFLSSSATVTDGITGDFGRLTASDVSSARAYEGSRGTVVEITLNEQTDTGSGKSDGSVAHGIYIVGDLLSVMSQLKDKGLPIDIDAEKTVIKYTKPVIKAVISEDGKVINGTWSCNVEISLSDYKFAGSPVDSTRVVLDNKITVNGGFSA